MKFGAMKTHRRNTMFLLVFLLVASGGALAFALMALNQNLNLFYTPRQILNGEAPLNSSIRAGGMVAAGSLVRGTQDLSLTFVISDLQGASVTVQYVGILPDLFREGQGVIARGRLDEQGLFQAQEVLAKHDENYMPPEVAAVIAGAHEEAKASGTYAAGKMKVAEQHDLGEQRANQAPKNQPLGEAGK